MTSGPDPFTGAPLPASPPAVVIDTNIALDLLLFDDPAARPLRAALSGGRLQWLATAAMREELSRVLGYDRVRSALAARAVSAAQVLQEFDRCTRIVLPALRARTVCRDPDDQKFVDLAVQQGCLLLSKDGDLLSLRKRLARLQVITAAVLPRDYDARARWGGAS